MEKYPKELRQDLSKKKTSMSFPKFYLFEKKSDGTAVRIFVGIPG